MLEISPVWVICIYVKKKKEKQKNQDRATMDKKKENLTTHKTCIHLYFQDD